MRFDLNELSFKGHNAAAMGPKSLAASGLAFSMGRRGLSSTNDDSKSPHTIKREPSAEESLAAESRRSVNSRGAISVSVEGEVNATTRLPLMNAPSVYDCCRCSTIVGPPSFHKTWVP